MESQEELKEIAEMIDEAGQYGLEVETIWSALLYMKEHPNASIKEATDFGLNEWIK